VVVNDLNVLRAAVAPAEAQAELIIDANAVLTSTIATAPASVQLVRI
jgi:hypothetical protein